MSSESQKLLIKLVKAISLIPYDKEGDLSKKKMKKIIQNRENFPLMDEWFDDDHEIQAGHVSTIRKILSENKNFHLETQKRGTTRNIIRFCHCFDENFQVYRITFRNRIFLMKLIDEEDIMSEDFGNLDTVDVLIRRIGKEEFLKYYTEKTPKTKKSVILDTIEEGLGYVFNLLGIGNEDQNDDVKQK